MGTGRGFFYFVWAHITGNESGSAQHAVHQGSHPESLPQERKVSSGKGNTALHHTALRVIGGHHSPAAVPAPSLATCRMQAVGRHTGHGCGLHSPGETFLTTLEELSYDFNKVSFLKDTNVFIQSEGRAWKSESCVLGFLHFYNSINTCSPLLEALLEPRKSTDLS